jgi:hypothetical protein
MVFGEDLLVAVNRARSGMYVEERSRVQTVVVEADGYSEAKRTRKAPSGTL